MASGRCRHFSDLPPAAGALLRRARRGVLATLDARGRPHVVPVCFVVRGDVIVTPIDAKPKGRRPPARRTNIGRVPAATFLVDHWSERWTELGWIMVRGSARLVPLDRTDDLLARYPQYREVAPGEEAVALEAEEIVWWLWEEDR